MFKRSQIVNGLAVFLIGSGIIWMLRRAAAKAPQLDRTPAAAGRTSFPNVTTTPTFWRFETMPDNAKELLWGAATVAVGLLMFQVATQVGITGLVTNTAGKVRAALPIN